MTITEQTYTPEQAPAVIDELRAVLDHVNGQVETYAHDLRLINTELQAEARNRNWCAEYEGFVERVNEQLAGDIRLTVRSITSCFDISVRLRLTHPWGERPTERTMAQELYHYLCRLSEDEDRDDHDRNFDWAMPRVDFIDGGE